FDRVLPQVEAVVIAGRRIEACSDGIVRVRQCIGSPVKPQCGCKRRRVGGILKFTLNQVHPSDVRRERDKPENYNREQHKVDGRYPRLATPPDILVSQKNWTWDMGHPNS